MIPQLPRLLHAALQRQARPNDVPPDWFEQYAREQRATQRWLKWLALAVAALAALQALALLLPVP